MKKEDIITYRGGKMKRHIFFNCLLCGYEFTRRSDYVKKMTGLCTKCANTKAGEKRKTHGFNNSNSRLHVTWSNMKRRCLKPVGKEKRNYKGISLCKEWHDFVNFMEWALANGYNDKNTIDRIECDKGYFPGNCRFVGYSHQSANRKISDKNTSGFIGVYAAPDGKYNARLQWRGRQLNLGRHFTTEEAAE